MKKQYGIIIIIILTFGSLSSINCYNKPGKHPGGQDTESPVARLANTPPNITNSTGLNVSVTGDDVEWYKYNLDGTSWSDKIKIDTPITGSGLVDGTHTIDVIGCDLAGNWQETGEATEYSWTIDTTAPVAQLTGTPNNPTSTTGISIIVGGSNVISYRYNLDNNGWSADTDIATPITASGLGDGSHSVQVIGKDLAGNWQDTTGATAHSWIVDTVAPIAQLSGTPNNPTNVTGINITVSGSNVMYYRYNLDNNGWSTDTDISMPITASGLADGSHTIQVIGRDLANNWQDTGNAAVYSWTVDAQPPSGTFVINNDDRYTTSTSVTLNMNISGAAEMRFSNDNITWSGWEAYASTKSWNLVSGHGGRTVYGEFRDTAGNLLQNNDIITPLLEQKITASEGSAEDKFGGTNDFNPNGNCIAVSNNGNVFVVGAYFDAGTSGSAYAYRWSGTVWNEYKLTSKVTAQQFGFSVALSNDGSTILIGALNGDSGEGSAFIYRWNGSGYGVWDGSSHWDENQKIKPSDPAASTQFGVSVSISGDGKTILVGEYRDNLGGSLRGSAYLYKWDESQSMYGIKNNGTSNGDENQKITASDGSDGSQFGFNVAISSDSSTIIIGAIANLGTGAAYVYKWNEVSQKYGSWNSGHWDENFKLRETDAIWFGRSVASSIEGNTLLVGAYRSTVGTNTLQGAVYLYMWNGSGYDKSKKFTASDGSADDCFGYIVSISGNGDRVLIGSLGDDVGANANQGSAYIYDYDGSNWVETILRASDGSAYDFFGYSAGISSDSHTIVIGAPGKTVGANVRQGAAYIY